MGRKKNVAIADDEYSFPADDLPEPPSSQGPEKENRVAPKKNKKGGKGQRNADDGVEPEKPAVADDALAAAAAAAAAAEDEDEIPVVFSGKKKSSKSKKNTVASSAFNVLVDEDDNEEPEPEPKRKPKSKPEVNNHAVEDEGDESKDLDGEFARQGGMEDATLKKQQKKKKKKGGRTAQEEEDLDKLLSELGEGPPAAFNAPPPVPTPAAEEEAEGNDNEVTDAGLESNKQGGAAEEAASKKKKKKKKSGRTAQEEEDLDKILAELGEVPAQPVSAAAPAPPPPVVEVPAAVPPEQAEAAGDEKEEESAAPKKKKKKKDKKAAAAAATAAVEAKEEKKEEAKGKGPEKKLPKHVREMQEALARRKEAEERKKREEEERLRKVEEERKRLEELERLAEEAKRRKKEREKEKLLKKKQEGKLLTGKQKEEHRRLEAMRKQFLAQSEVPIGDAGGETKKRPKYDTKKSKHAQPKAVEAEKVAESQPEADEPTTEPAVEDAMAQEESVSQVEEAEDNIEANQEPEEDKAIEEDEDEDEWDAKSWDDVDVTLPAISAFAEEDQEEVQAKPVHKKGVEHVASSTPVEPQANTTVPTKPTVKKVVAPRAPSKKGDVENNENGRENVSTSNIKRGNEVVTKQELKAVDDKSKKSSNDLRSPICCILGHVDTGKTKLLDCIRCTNVQEGEAGGITQQIGATYFPTENIRERTKELKADATLKVPGLLVIDTPGHESFTNLRSRGSSLCDIAILVVDIMHGLEPQTIESLNLLKSRNTEFIVALNKVDRLYGWKTCRNAPIVKALKQQSNDVKNEFNMRLTQIITQFKEQGLNTALYYKNREMGETFNIVPTSAISGEGIPDLLLLLVQWAQKTMEEKLTYVDEVQCTVLEVKVIEGLGTTIDVVLVNGVLHEGDQVVLCGMQGPIVTNIRALLTPHPMKELRVKGSYLHHKELKAAQGVKISAQGLEHAIAGTALYAVKPEDNLEDIKEAVMQEMNKVMSRIDKSGEGVYVQASTLGSLEALTEFLKSPDVSIPFSDFNIGPVHKKDVMKASVMLERKKEYATILAFDVKVMPDARELAEETGVRIFVADIIYHLFDQFKAYIDNLREEKKKESAEEAVFPCVLRIMPNCVFNKKDPIVLGVDVLEGIVKVGTPICIPSRDFIDIGRITSVEINHKQVDVATKGQKVAIKIVGSSSDEQQKMYGRHFEIDDELVSHISRRSIDILKANYRDDLSLEEWKLVVRLKQIFKIP
ncbi:eukaryotic translation initiation factor 5B-like [Phoenix dactylifera]|uniref:Eukaryotic translation initiation factor 5B n=1 Tax=Phoenix dactylifera TaxID=42345 RepID=A0A8B7CYR3_PHODC|nr:eukaryotic translation initiation factor 5B-like [Phoenix dactylifera]